MEKINTTLTREQIEQERKEFEQYIMNTQDEILINQVNDKRNGEYCWFFVEAMFNGWLLAKESRVA